jgi:cyclopropane-fatty-acyl-phospholipid synthase
MNGLKRARRNAAHHYDIGNELYRTFLDADMQYSCGYFPAGDESLETAQLLKKRHIAAKMQVREGMTVLDIGCGWGGMGLYLAGVCGARVIGVSLAEEQVKLARARAEAAGLADRVEFRLLDYRNVTENFDRIVSVGMLEHVGGPNLPEYFRAVRDRLNSDGLALIHSISTCNPPGITSAFLEKYIFPGGYCPTISESTAAIEKAGLWLTDCEMWRVHYARTLREWRQRFMAAELPERYDARFRRMWEFYLASCEAAFDTGPSTVFQLQLGRDRDAAPLHRDYIPMEEAALARKEQEVEPRLRETARIAA